MQRAMQREALAPDILDDDHIHRRMLFWPANRNTVAFAEHTAGVKIAPQLYTGGSRYTRIGWLA